MNTILHGIFALFLLLAYFGASALLACCFNYLITRKDHE